MNIYTDQCPYCGTYIRIANATVCPGCSKSIFYGPDPNWSVNSRRSSPGHDYSVPAYFYFADKRSRDEAISNAVVVEQFWASEEGSRERTRRQAQEEFDRNNYVPISLQGGGKTTIGWCLIGSIPVAWFFLGGYKWDNFGWFFWLALISGILFLWFGKDE